jgi:hypothetical protein
MAKVNNLQTKKEEVFKKYLQLKAQELNLKKEMDELKDQFKELNMDGFMFEDKTLKLQERNTKIISDDIIPILKQLKILEKAVSPDKKRIDALVKVKLLDATLVEQYTNISTTTAWTVK